MAVIPRSRSRPRRRLAGEVGVSLVEVLITVAILSVGVLGIVSLIDGASATTSSNRAREAATALARELVESSRSVPYDQLTDADLPGLLQQRAALADASAAAGWTVARRTFTFDISVTACSIDDPKDGLGSHDVDVQFCADSPGPANPPKDRNVDDYKRVTVVLSWQRGGRTESARQTSIVGNPAGGFGPSVRSISMTSPASSPITTNVATASFSVQTSSVPASVNWYVNGDLQGQATGSGTSWSFDWALLNGAVPTFLDGTYLVHAQGFDSEGRSGATKSMTVTLNRFAPEPPGGFAGGRNGSGSDVDLEWHAAREGDVVGYRVYRASSDGTPGERACPAAGAGTGAFLTASSCVDQGAPSGSGLHYVLVALDTDASGTLREGTATSALAIVEGNAIPATPAGLTACSGGTQGCNAPDGTPAAAGTTVLTWQAATDPDTGDSVDFYRIYRDGTAYDARLDRLYPTDGPLVWVDRDPGGVQHDYRITAVDSRFGESAPTAAVTR